MDQDVHVRDVVKYRDYKRSISNATILYDGQNIANNGQQHNQQPKKKAVDFQPSAFWV
jgi:hypothetical protein